MSLDKLEKKIDERRITNNKVEKAEDVEIKVIDTDKIIEEIKRNYRLISNINRREEKRLQYIENKLDFIIKAIESSGVDVEEMQKQKEIKKLEQQLNELKGGN